LAPVSLDLDFDKAFASQRVGAYERLLLDAMAGDATLFARRDEVEEAWKFIDHIEQAWHQSDTPPPMANFTAGSWGPKEADELLHQDGHAWRRL
jgi:glucose-6-phosphate 1-dehydrogenase